MPKTETLTERLERLTRYAFLASLYNRVCHGETLKAGESYIFLNPAGNVEERKANQEDLDKVLSYRDRMKKEKGC